MSDEDYGTNLTKIAEQAARIAALEAALQSIAANTCCDSCREAALVARAVLAAAPEPEVGK